MKNTKTLIGLAGGMFVVSVGMFAYQNVYVPNNQESELTSIYVAKQDISSGQEISESDFERVEVSKDYVIPSYAQSLPTEEGLAIRGGLLQGDVLTNNRIVDKESETGTFKLSIKGDNIKAGDSVNVYERIYNNRTEEFAFNEIISNKKVIAENVRGSNSEVSLSVNNSKEEVPLYILVEEDELERYHASESRGEIVIIKKDLSI